jgi:hypothetical protein
MASTIKIKNSSTAGAVPTASDLVQGELAINVTDRRIYTENASGTVVELGTPSIDDNGNATAITIDSSENVGVGVTPSAWNSGYKVVEFGKIGTSLFSGTSSGNAILSSNAYLNSSDSWTYANNGGAVYFRAANSDRSFSWNISSTGSGTAGNAITFTQAMTLDASGNLVVGATSATAGTKLDVNGAIYARTDVYVNATSSNIVDINGSCGMGIVGGSSGYLKLSTNNAERARIDSSGRYFIGTTSSTNTNAKLVVNGYISQKGIVGRQGTGGADGDNSLFNLYWTGSAQLWVDATNIGNIATSSDYRIKKNIQTQTSSGIDRILQLRPVTYELADYGTLFKADGLVRDGFIAHEVQEVIPSGAEGQKDEEGRIQNLRSDAILAVAVKAIQEQQAIITQLQADVAALKA